MPACLCTQVGPALSERIKAVDTFVCDETLGHLRETLRVENMRIEVLSRPVSVWDWEPPADDEDTV